MRRELVSVLVLGAATGSALPASSAPSRVTYAQQCAATMGAIATFNCMNGTVIPITKNGAAQTQPVSDCDRPIQLGITGSSQCVPYARLLRLNTSNSAVETVAICRKYHGSTGPSDSTFHDIAVIQHNKSTGETCFFQSKLDIPINGTAVPSPQADTPAASAVWLENTGDGPGGVRCTRCHDADPFVWSPYVAQVVDITKWNPLGLWHSNYQGLFSKSVRTFKPDNNACTACHRVGEETCRIGAAISIHEYADQRLMPIGFQGTAAQWQQTYGAAMTQLDQCCNNPGIGACKTLEAVDSRNHVFDCTPIDVAVFPKKRIHVQCSPGDGPISWFALATADNADAERTLEAFIEATTKNMRLTIWYDRLDLSGASVGCQNNDCRIVKGVRVF